MWAAGSFKFCPDCSANKQRRAYHWDSAKTDGPHYDANYYDYIARNFNAKALRLGVEGKVTGPELKFIFDTAGGGCARRGSPERPHFDHVVSFACRGRNAAENIQLLCQRCSLRKGPECMDFRGAAKSDPKWRKS